MSVDYPLRIQQRQFLQKLSNQVPKLSVSTLGAYMGLTRKVLQHAARHSFIQHIPEFPKVGIEDKPRGWGAAGSTSGHIVDLNQFYLLRSVFFRLCSMRLICRILTAFKPKRHAAGLENSAACSKNNKRFCGCSNFSAALGS
jgi:hypothetical protein